MGINKPKDIETEGYIALESPTEFTAPTYYNDHACIWVTHLNVRSLWTSRFPFAVRWYVESISSDRLFLKKLKDMPK